MPRHENHARLDVDLTGAPGPTSSKKTPFDGDTCTLWRLSQYGSPFNLSGVPTRRRIGFSGKKDDGEKALDARAGLLGDLQELLWAHVRAAGDDDRRAVSSAIAARAPRRNPRENMRRKELFSPEVEDALRVLERGPRVLLVLQGMDASGKGGMVKSVMTAMDPLGVDVRAFGKPTRTEAREHYLQRIIRALPAPGHVGVFDRSYYEDVLVPTVQGTEAEETLGDRVEALRIFEAELVRKGFVLIKVLLHISPEEQLERLLDRLDREHKHWKFDPSDVDAREEFQTYQTVYSALLEATDADHAPWHVIGADRKWYSRLAVQELLIAALDDLSLRWPPAAYNISRKRARLKAALGG
ncbi:PPK2 family polyphosphate kinase [Nesterenkonia flava]|uniref:Polyphosphate kinase 2 family protein n=1 Tax=Nesterenkonia flava TaxID=469799 RepID=A0ABU1FWI2_9MICC|nr:PPK2 family polyphosphate kinase [Nesterenkonia flava]MDR5712682.1 polyphosphate kinase 2 family protein [Nesterenkonia flava]